MHSETRIVRAKLVGSCLPSGIKSAILTPTKIISLQYSTVLKDGVNGAGTNEQTAKYGESNQTKHN